jgi:hypothetical protein
MAAADEECGRRADEPPFDDCSEAVARFSSGYPQMQRRGADRRCASLRLAKRNKLQKLGTSGFFI